jgi:hypothetical protein
LNGEQLSRLTRLWPCPFSYLVGRRELIQYARLRSECAWELDSESEAVMTDPGVGMVPVLATWWRSYVVDRTLRLTRHRHGARERSLRWCSSGSPSAESVSPPWGRPKHVLPQWREAMDACLAVGAFPLAAFLLTQLCSNSCDDFCNGLVVRALQVLTIFWPPAIKPGTTASKPVKIVS